MTPTQATKYKQTHTPLAAAAASVHPGSPSMAGLFSGRRSPVSQHPPLTAPEQSDATKALSTVASPPSAVPLTQWKTDPVLLLKSRLSSGKISADELLIALADETIFKRFNAEDLRSLALAGVQVSGALLQFLQSPIRQANPALLAMIREADEYNKDTRSLCRRGGF